MWINAAYLRTVLEITIIILNYTFYLISSNFTAKSLFERVSHVSKNMSVKYSLKYSSKGEELEQISIRRRMVKWWTISSWDIIHPLKRLRQSYIYILAWKDLPDIPSLNKSPNNTYSKILSTPKNLSILCIFIYINN